MISVPNRSWKVIAVGVVLLGALGALAYPLLRGGRRGSVDPDEMRMVADYEQIAEEGRNAVTRGNAFAAVQMTRCRARAPEALLVQARAGKRDGRSALLVDAWPLKDARDKVIFVFIDGNSRTSRLVYDLKPYPGPVASSGCFGFVRYVEANQIERIMDRHGGAKTISGNDLWKAFDVSGAVFILPDDVEIAVGFGFPSGAYSNFIRIENVVDQDFDIPRHK